MHAQVGELLSRWSLGPAEVLCLVMYLTPLVVYETPLLLMIIALSAQRVSSDGYDHRAYTGSFALGVVAL